MTARTLFLMLALVLLFQGVPAVTVEAQNRSKEEAEEHYRLGIELVKEEQFDQAIIEFKRAYELSRDYKKLYNLGTTYMVLGNSVKAVETYKLYLKKGGGKIPSARRNEVIRYIAQHKERIAYLDIRVNIPGAQVLVNGEKIGESPLSQKVAVTTGDHEVIVKKEGYQEEERKVTLAGKDDKTLSFTLIELHSTIPVPSAENGQLAITCAVPNVQVSIADRILGKTPFKSSILVAVGEHEVRFTREGYTTDNQIARIKSDEIETIECNIQPLGDLHDTQESVLYLSISEDGATAQVDGVLFDNVRGKRLPAGRHFIEIKRSGFSPWTKTVDLEPGESLELDVDLVPLDDYRKEYESRANAMRTWAMILGAAGIVTGGLSLGLYLKNDSEFDEYQQEFDSINLEASGQLTPTSQEDLLKRQEKNNDKLHDIHDMDAVVVGLAIGGGALFITGLIIFLIGDDPGKYEGVVAVVDGNSALVGWSSTW